MSQAAQYAPKLVVVTFRGVELVAPADGSIVEATRNTDGFSLLVGAHGDGVWVQSHDRSGVVTWRALQSSPSNDYLNAQAADDELTGEEVGPLQIEDLNGNTLVFSEQARVRKRPDVTRAGEHSPVEWVFLCHDLAIDVGGSTR